ncbi:immunoglobulin superfamily member 2-like [Lepidochelys kempii]|uniref:immunoglobulin superfamily member 2-like n=1 Tax=Lepidochelys kempii TaxID=8472 RepID=UPI003C6EBD6A
MGSVQRSAALLLFVLAGLCVGQRVVLVQKGRLYRARGYHITIWCKVSGYQGPSEQNFQWSIYLPSAPEREVQIISTMDPSFPYAIYTQRVRSGEIYVERVQGDSALLHITELQDRDAGEYECHTPTTDERYFGSYSAKMNLSVIPDTLSATMTPQALIQVEGDPLELTCEVSKSTAQHTHLSVAWYHLQGSGDGQAMVILSLSKDFILTPGSSYTQRFLSDVRLDKVGDTTYKLSIGRVQPSDQGQVYCEAVEWIQDPDGTWKDIARKKTEKTSLTIRSHDRDFQANIAAVESSLAEGEPLQVNCSVKAQNSQNRWFQVVWLFKGVEVARIDPHGVLALKEEYEERAALGHLQVVKKSNELYILKVYQVELKDKGTYSCKVSEMEKASTGFSTTQFKTSSDIDVNVMPIESHMHVSVLGGESQIVEGDTLILHCEVSGATSPLLVNWWHLRKNGDQPEHIVGMEQDGMLRPGPSYQERSANRDLRLEKMNSTTFTLAIYNTSATDDGGSYKCEVTEWSKDRSWKQAQETSVAISPLSLNLRATLRSRTANVKFTQDFELFCQVSATHLVSQVPISVTWQFKTIPEANGYQQLVKIMPCGTIEWGAAQPHFQRKTRVTKSASSSELLIHSATEQDAGRYRCEVEVWRRSCQQARHPAMAAAAAVKSNVVEIKVNPPESKLRVNTEDRSLEISGGADTEIECRVTSLTQRDSQLAITWYFLPPSPADAAPLQIVRANYSNILDYGAEFSSAIQKSKFHSERVSSNLFWLHILSVNHGDRGRYYCLVEEWLWSPDRGWYKLGKKESGKTMLEFKVSENKLHVEKTNHSITATENKDVTMSCLLQGPSQPASLFSAIWLHGLEHSGMKTLVKVHANGMVEYAEEKMAGRLHLRRPSFGDFSLVLRSVEPGDAGLYCCQVQEWQQDSSGSWVQRASEVSGYTRLTALPPADDLQVQVASSAAVLQENQGDLHLDCNFILGSPGIGGTAFSVTWWRMTGGGREELFSVNHSSMFQYGPATTSTVRNRLRFERPGELQYRLTLLRPEVSDSGDYQCHGELWVFGPGRGWYQRSVRHSGNITVLILPAESTISSRVCSSPSLLHFILIYPLILFLGLIAALLYLYVKNRQTHKESIYQRKGKELWVDLKGAGDVEPTYSDHSNLEEEMNNLKEEKMD